MIVMGLALIGFASRVFGREYGAALEARQGVARRRAARPALPSRSAGRRASGRCSSAILTFAAPDRRRPQGAALLVAYSLGLGVPFLIAGLATSSTLSVLGVFKRHGALVNRIGGVVMVGVGHPPRHRRADPDHRRAGSGLELLTGPPPAAPALFDFNGTISLDEPILDRLFQEAFAAHRDRARLRAIYYAELSGLSDPEIVERASSCTAARPTRRCASGCCARRSTATRQVVLEEPTVPADDRRGSCAPSPSGCRSRSARARCARRSSTCSPSTGCATLFDVLVDDRRRGARQARPGDVPALPGAAARAPSRPRGRTTAWCSRTRGSASPPPTRPACAASRCTRPATWSALAAADLVVQGLTGELALGLFGTEGG